MESTSVMIVFLWSLTLPPWRPPHTWSNSQFLILLQVGIPPPLFKNTQNEGPPDDPRVILLMYFWEDVPFPFSLVNFYEVSRDNRNCYGRYQLLFDKMVLDRLDRLSLYGSRPSKFSTLDYLLISYRGVDGIQWWYSCLKDILWSPNVDFIEILSPGKIPGIFFLFLLSPLFLFLGSPLTSETVRRFRLLFVLDYGSVYLYFRVWFLDKWSQGKWTIYYSPKVVHQWSDDFPFLFVCFGGTRLLCLVCSLDLSLYRLYHLSSLILKFCWYYTIPK